MWKPRKMSSLSQSQQLIFFNKSSNAMLSDFCHAFCSVFYIIMCHHRVKKQKDRSGCCLCLYFHKLVVLGNDEM